MGKPAFIFTDYHASATVTATDTLTGTDADNILLATEDTVWSPADATGTKDITIDLFSAFAFDRTAILGENLSGLQVGVFSSTDNFVADEQALSSTGETVTNGNFLTDTDWSKGAGWSINTGTAVYFGSAANSISQSITVESGKTYSYSIDFVTSLNSADFELIITDGITPEVVVNMSAGAGEYRGSHTTSLSGVVTIKIESPAVIAGTSTFDNVKFMKFDELTVVNNSAIISHDTSSSRYLKYTIGNPSTSLQIAHIAPDLLVEQPWLEDDWGTEGVQSEFKNLISVDGYYLGTTQTKTMRDININFGEITDAEYIGQVEPWVTSRIKTSSAFFFIPDVDDLSEVYFCWLVDGQGFKAPLKQGVRMAEAIRCLTRLA